MNSVSVIAKIAKAEASAGLALAGCSVAAGFPSPADDFIEERLDLNKLLVQHPACTFLVRVKGLSMVGAGINDGDLLVVDRVLRAKHGDIVIAIVDDDLTVKTLYDRMGRVRLQAANPTYPDIIPKENQTLEIWGVVISSITVHRKA